LHATGFCFEKRGVAEAKATRRLFLGKRKGHLLFPPAFIPLLNERGCLGASYPWSLSPC